MTPAPSNYPHRVRVPLHFWLLGLLILLWNCWGLFGAIAAQVRLFPGPPIEAIAHVDQQPLWFMLLGDLSPLAGVAGSLALLVQSRWAPALFVAQLAVLLLTNAYEVAIGRSPLIDVPEVQASTAFLLVVLVAQTFFAFRMARKGLLG